MERALLEVPPHLRRALLDHLRKKRQKGRALPLFVLFLVLFCSYLIYRSLNPVLPSSQESPRFYSNQCQTDLRLLFTTAIESAQKSIHLVVFGLTDPVILRTIGERVRGGVSAAVYYDPKASSNVRSKLRGAKLVPVQQGGLMHQKILIVDHDLVLLGSANMTSASLRMHDNLVIGFRSPSVSNFLLEHPPYTAGYLRAMVGGQDLELWLLPDHRGHVVNELRRLIRGASRSIKMALFTFTHPGLCEEVIAAKKRGVAVSVVIDKHNSFGASAKVIEQLRLAGITLRYNQGVQLMHHKFLWIDDQMLICGSANWTKAAFHKNSDLILILRRVNEEQKRFMSKLWYRIFSEAVIYTQRD